MSSLADAIANGQGIERPFQCEAHDDHQASASVNVVLGVWYCFACQASGRIDPKSKRKAPSVAELQAMLDPEVSVRCYSEAYLELFDNDLGNWATRFPAWVRWSARFGCDPLTGDATFPVRTPSGQLAGVGRRREHPAESESRFRYPPRWSASRSMFIAGRQSEILSLVEGASDSVAIAEAGGYAAAAYGSGLHFPQMELIARVAPKLVVLAFDDDDAGRRAVHGWDTDKGRHVPGARELLADSYEVVTLDWGELGVKDAAAASVEGRRELLAKTVGSSYYGAQKTNFVAELTIRSVQDQADYDFFVRENYG
jgi:hypothetical protein